MICPLCGLRKARRGCPALGKQICAFCCGTKRLVEIQCPSDCPWLASAREHPPAVVVRRQQQDLGLLVQFMRDLSERQSQLFFLVNTFLVQYAADAAIGTLASAIRDEDVSEAMTALASTFETASRGVIYEHRPASLPAERLMTALKPVLAEAGKGRGSAFERDAAVVLRRVADAVSHARSQAESAARTPYLELIGRVIERPTRGSASSLIAPPGA